ncbi:MAG: dual specificity protein phosphatase [Cyanobacteria bacterium J06626_18]
MIMLGTYELAVAEWLEVSPCLNASLDRYMLETVDILLRVQSPFPPIELQVQVWTNLPTRFSSEGTWYAIDVPHHKPLENPPSEQPVGGYLFQTSLRPTSPGKFELTYRVSHRATPEQWQWMGNPTDNTCLQVAPPAPDREWTQRPNHVEILHGVYVGNFIAASQAETLGFDAVLNMAEELNPTFAANSKIAYQKLPCRDGARHPIPEASLREAIAWIEHQLAQDKQQILIHCRAGIGRSGSVGVAYCFYKHPHWSYRQALEYVWSKKPDVYPHSQLQESLEQLFPRPVTQ